MKVEAPVETDAFKLVIVTAGTSAQSTTTQLSGTLARATEEAARGSGHPLSTKVIDLRDHARDIAHSIATGASSERMRALIAQVSEADGVIAATPVYKAGPSGLFTSFWNLVDDDAVLATPVILAATAGTPRHALVPDEVMRPMFAYLRALVVPTSVFAATEDWADPAGVNRRAKRAGGELAILMQAGVREKIRSQADAGYRRSFDTGMGTAENAEDELDFDSELMRLAAGGL